ncbi:protein O-mannosyl-transferase family [Mariniphaga sp.]|uniref:protein O-mannosyl-transferase family n=1 Tax=Mariniphaga sp. TaxID=1954475 RepID=UPI003562EB4C
MYRKNTINIILGWVVFLIAFITYLFTIEPTASWWDCSEFIISAYKLEVGHPPGAPLHIILGRFFSLFASDVSQVAFMVNLLSALASAGTVMLLYWSIVHLARKLFPEQPSKAEQIVVWGSGLVGALAFAFTDSFWFSAVEGEVYALSSFFTAAVFWAILKWENEAGQKYADRWLILIAYLMGLSTGVHLLNLLAIPAIGLVYYFKKYEFSWKGAISALIISALVLTGIQYVLIPDIPKLAFLFDLFFVNTLGLPFNTGMLAFLVLLAAGLVWAIRYTRKRKLVVWNTAITAVVVILIGYSTFALILIRADANPPMNQNHPDNAFALRRYLNREQYGDRPLLFGNYYNAPAIASSGEKKYYNQVNGRYVVTGTSASKTVYDSRMKTIFPRMYSSDPRHVEVYKNWGNVKGKPVRVREGGEVKTLMKPTFGENLRFFFTYQVGHMYFRYFMWNFTGRQNDAQGHGNFMNGNWISGIKFLDEARIGPQDNLPDFMKNEPSKNTYYFLPLLFGLIGLFYQYNHSRKGKEGFAVVMTLFILTGIAIIVYLNQTPVQPRERDYAYTGSFYAFAIWIGLAVPALFSAFQKIVKGVPGAVLVILISLGLVPGVLATQNWDDHNRSNRYMTRDYAINYLESCAPNAILFTYGDNDTFPLWYVQEVEGVRTDIKVINISYLSMDWYISQHRMATYEAKPVPFSFEENQYYTGIRDGVFIQDRLNRAVDLRDAMEFMGSDDERTKAETAGGQKVDYFPSSEFYLPVNKQKVLETGTVQPEDAALISDTVQFKINKRYVTKSEWAVLNMIAANDWERPIYIDHSLLYTNNIFFTDWLQFEGLAYRFVPVKTESRAMNMGHINTSILYENVMNKFVWGNVNHPDVFLDDYNKKAIRIIQARYMFARLAEALVNEGLNKKAEEVIDKMFELFPNEKMPLTYDSFPAVEQYLRAGAIDKGIEKARQMAENGFAMLNYYFSLPEHFARAVQEEQEREMGNIQNLLVLTRPYNLQDLNSEIDGRLQQMISRLSDELQ